MTENRIQFGFEFISVISFHVWLLFITFPIHTFTPSPSAFTLKFGICLHSFRNVVGEWMVIDGALSFESKVCVFCWCVWTPHLMITFDHPSSLKGRRGPTHWLTKINWDKYLAMNIRATCDSIGILFPIPCVCVLRYKFWKCVNGNRSTTTRLR